MLRLTTKVIMGAATCAMLSLPAMANSALDNGVDVCGVPVCSLVEGVSELKALNPNQRGSFLLSFKSTYKDTKDLQVLENVYQFGLKAKKVTEELKDEDWVWREANAILNNALLGLAKFSPVDGAKFVGYFKLLATQQARYDMIAHWQNATVSLENVTTLEQLVVFAAGARDYSVVVGDEAWVAREASKLISEITIKMVHLDPAHEGLYDVTIEQAALDRGVFPFDRVAVLDSSTEKNLVVVFINTKHRHVVYKYNHAEIAGNKITGKVLSSADVANRFELTYDRASGEVSGTIETTSMDDIRFSGTQSFSTRGSYKGATPYALTASDVLGTMTGKVGSVEGTLTVKSFSPNVYSATFKSNTGSVLVHFQGKFFPETGVLSLTNTEKVKLTLSLRETAEGAKWQGHSFTTTTGKVSPAMFNTLR